MEIAKFWEVSVEGKDTRVVTCNLWKGDKAPDEADNEYSDREVAFNVAEAHLLEELEAVKTRLEWIQTQRLIKE